jgi:hypothetical protein
MIFEPKLFYKNYQKDYHKIKANYLKKMLDNLSRYSDEFLGKNPDEEELSTFKRTLQSDLRQTYFHAIETFFELFFALNPQGKQAYDDESILFALTHSKWRDNYKMIEEISEKENSLDFLDERMTFLGFDIKIGHYLFYAGIFSEKFPQDLFDRIDKSIEAIKNGIQILALDFSNREEYNAYKHALRLIPAAVKISLADTETSKVNEEWDIKESMSFYSEPKYPEELKVMTKVFDSERDYQMTYFCSNLIHHLIFYRRMMMKFNLDIEKYPQIPITFFDEKLINECNRIRVPIQDIVNTITRIDNTPEKQT